MSVLRLNFSQAASRVKASGEVSLSKVQAHEIGDSGWGWFAKRLGNEMQPEGCFLKLTERVRE